MFALKSPVIRRTLTLFAVLPLIVLCAGCADFWVSDSSIQSVTVSPTALILKAAQTGPPAVAGDSASISATATTVGGSSVTTGFTWTSSDTTDFTVTSAGSVTAIGTAADKTATITATNGGQSATCAILSYTGTTPTALNSIGGIPAASGQLSPGQTFQLTASANLSGNSSHDVTSYVSWVSSNTSAATVSTSGLVTVLSTATAAAQFTITATATISGTSISSPAASFTVL
jgi:hypothetical protein